MKKNIIKKENKIKLRIWILVELVHESNAFQKSHQDF